MLTIQHRAPVLENAEETGDVRVLTACVNEALESMNHQDGVLPVLPSADDVMMMMMMMAAEITRTVRARTLFSV